MIEFRRAQAADMDKILAIYEDARAFMKRSGNPDQWKSYPEEKILLEDIEKDRLYVAPENEQILAVFCYFSGDDPTYAEIDGAWKNSLPYGVIHRIAVSGAARGKGIAARCFDFAFSACGNLKIDTHKDNIPMQRALEKCGFEYCGVIRIESGDERIAFQKVN